MLYSFILTSDAHGQRIARVESYLVIYSSCFGKENRTTHTQLHSTIPLPESSSTYIRSTQKFIDLIRENFL